MTWAKISTEFPDELATDGISDSAFRTHVEGITWVYRVEDLKLRIPKHLIRRFAGSDEYELAVKELAGAGYWRDRGDSWEIIHHADVIRSGIIAQQQKRVRDKNAQRARRKRISGDSGTSAVSGDVSADINAESGTASAETQTTNQTSFQASTTYGRRRTA